MVSEKIVPGLKGRCETVVCEHNIAPHVKKFSTPSMVLLMEKAASAALQPYLESGQVSVGFEVNIRHVAPAPLGAIIVSNAEVTEISRNRISFTVDAYYGETKIGDGTHRRAIITPDPSS